MAEDMFPIRMGLGIASVAALTFLNLAIKKAREAAVECRRYSKADGEIIAWNEGWSQGGEDSEPGPCYLAQVRFQTAEGRNRALESGCWRSAVARVRISFISGTGRRISTCSPWTSLMRKPASHARQPQRTSRTQTRRACRSGAERSTPYWFAIFSITCHEARWFTWQIA